MGYIGAREMAPVGVFVWDEIRGRGLKQSVWVCWFSVIPSTKLEIIVTILASVKQRFDNVARHEIKFPVLFE